MKPLPPDIAAVAFDLDGTLVDSAADIRHALNSALGASGYPPFDLGKVRSMIGDGPDALIARALAHLGIDAPDAHLRRTLRQAFDRAALAAPLDHGHVFPGIVALLESLRERLSVVVVTNKPTPLARAVLEAAGLLPHMVEVYGADQPGLRKPAPDMIHAAAARLGLQAQQVLMVGDSALDLRAAAAAGSPAVHVSWGYGHADAGAPTPGSTPVWHVDTPAALQQALARPMIG